MRSSPILLAVLASVALDSAHALDNGLARYVRTYQYIKMWCSSSVIESWCRAVRATCPTFLRCACRFTSVCPCVRVVSVCRPCVRVSVCPCACVPGAPSPARALSFRVPQMGYNSWYDWTCNMDEKQLIQTVDAMVEKGLPELGYNYFNLDGVSCAVCRVPCACAVCRVCHYATLHPAVCASWTNHRTCA